MPLVSLAGVSPARPFLSNLRFSTNQQDSATTYRHGQVPKISLSPTRLLDAEMATHRVAKYPHHNMLDEIAKAFQSTHLIQTPERKALRYKWMDEIYGDGAEKQAHRIDIIIGNMATGKNGLAEKIKAHEGSLIIDPDAMSQKFPEFHFSQEVGMRVNSEKKALSMNSLVEEAWLLSKRVATKAMSKGDNIIMPYIGGDLNEELSFIHELKRKGYKIYYHFIDLPLGECVDRSVKRFHKDGRYTNLSKIVERGNGPWQTYQSLRIYGMEAGLVDGMFLWDSSGIRRDNGPILREVASLTKLNVPNVAKALDIVG